MYRLNYPQDPGMHNQWNQQKQSSSVRSACSVWSRLKSTWLSATFYLLLLCGATAIHLWNESNAVQLRRSLEEAVGGVRKLSTSDVVFEENNHKLVYMVGRLSTEQELIAEDYGIGIKAAKLRRRVEMYQWLEEENTVEVEEDDHSKMVTTYKYYKGWVPSVVRSDLFHYKASHENPREFPMVNSVEVADEIKVGNFILCKELVDIIDYFQPFTGHIRPQSPSIKLHAGLYYHTDDVWNPQIGDIRVEFARAGFSGEEHVETVSVIAMQEGRMLKPYTTQSGKTILIMHFGRRTPEILFNVQLSSNTWNIWSIRCTACFILLFAVNGMACLLHRTVSPSSTIHDILKMGVGTVSLSMFATIYAMVLFVTWILYKVHLGVFFLVASVVPFVMLFVKLYRIDNLENQQHHKA